jgi:tetratricopeptide (TPR) repeat protein
VLTRVLALTLAVLLPQAAGDPKAAMRLTAAADMDRVNGRYDAAIAGYRQALSIDPQFLLARRGIGTVLDLTGHHAEARAEYLAALDGRRQTYDGAMFLSSLATSFVFDRRFDEARAALKESSDLVVKRFGADAGNATQSFDLAMAAEAYDDADRALAAIYGSIEKPPALPASTMPDSHVLMPRLQWMRYNAQRAVVAARRGQAADARRLLAEADAQAKELGDVLARFSQTTGTAVGLKPASELVLPKAEAAFWLGDTAEAVRLFATQALMAPRHQLLLAQACEREHKPAEARAAYIRVVESTQLSIELAWARPIAQERLAALGR